MMAREVEAKLVLSAQDRTARAFQAIERRLRGVEQKATRANRMARQADRFEQAAARTTRSMYATTARLAAPLIAAGGLSSGLRTLTSYEDALTEIRKKGGFAEDQMGKLAKEARDLATSGDVAVSLDEILSAYERGAAAGLPLEDLREFAELSAKASDAFGMTAEEVGNAAAGFNVGLGIPISQMEQYFDLINSLADSGISDESDIIKYLDNAGAALKNFGLSAEEAAAYGAAFLNLKLSPETAARMTNALTSKLIAPENLGDEAYGVFSEFVGDVGEFKDLLKGDAQSALRKFLGDLAKLDKFERARVTGKIFGMEWSDEIMRVVEGMEEVDRNISAAANRQGWLGSLEKSYQLKLNTLSSQWQLFQNQIAETVIDVGMMGMPALKAGLDYSRDRVKEIGEGLEQFRAKVDMTEFEDAKQAIAELSEAITSLLNLGGDGQSAIEQAFDRLASAANAVTGAVNIGRDFAETLGLVEDDGEAPQKESDRLQSWMDNYIEWNYVVRRGVDLVDNYVAGGQWRREREARVSGQPLAPSHSEHLSDEISELNAQIADLVSKGADAAMIARLEEIVALKSFGMQAVAGPVTRNGEAVDHRVSDAFGDLPDSRLPAISEDLDASTDRLREAMEASGAIVTTSGSDAGSKIQDGAQAGAAALTTAAQAIENAGRNAAAAISAVRIPLPQDRFTTSRPLSNRAPAESMPDAGTPGG